MSSMPDSAQTLAAIALFADGKTRIKNIGNLKFKESDRISDTASELRKLGANVKVKNDELIITKSQLKPAIIDSHNDHQDGNELCHCRIEKFLGIKINNPECVNKSFRIFDKLKSMWSQSSQSKNIVLIGYRAPERLR